MTLKSFKSLSCHYFNISPEDAFICSVSVLRKSGFQTHRHTDTDTDMGVGACEMRICQGLKSILKSILQKENLLFKIQSQAHGLQAVAGFLYKWEKGFMKAIEWVAEMGLFMQMSKATWMAATYDTNDNL